MLERFKVGVRGMEQFGARSETPKETCLAEVEQCDVYVGIIAFRLGSLDPQSGKSFTQLEYDHALRLGKEILIYLADEQEARFRRQDYDVDQSRLDEFKKILGERHVINPFSTPADLADKLKTDFAKRFQPVVEEGESTESEFESALKLIQRFRLLPKLVNGREVRLEIVPIGQVFPAKRALCKAFNLEYGSTIGTHIRIVKPHPRSMGGFQGDVGSFDQIYASGLRVDEFLSVMANRQPVEVYARLQFTPDDVPSGRAQFFGYSYHYEDPEPGDPDVEYLAPEGRVILVFSKLASPRLNESKSSATDHS